MSVLVPVCVSPRVSGRPPVSRLCSCVCGGGAAGLCLSGVLLCTFVCASAFFQSAVSPSEGTIPMSRYAPVSGLFPCVCLCVWCECVCACGVRLSCPSLPLSGCTCVCFRAVQRRCPAERGRLSPSPSCPQTLPRASPGPWEDTTRVVARYGEKKDVQGVCWVLRVWFWAFFLFF